MWIGIEDKSSEIEEINLQRIFNSFLHQPGEQGHLFPGSSSATPGNKV